MEAFFSSFLAQGLPSTAAKQTQPVRSHWALLPQLQSCGASSNPEARERRNSQAWQHPSKDLSTYLSFPKSLILSFSKNLILYEVIWHKIYKIYNKL